MKFNKDEAFAIVLMLLVGLASWSCEKVVEYPEMGAEEMVSFKGVVGEANPKFTVGKLSPITNRHTYGPMEGDGVQDASLSIMVNGKNIEVRPVSAGSSCEFTVDYAFAPGDEVKISAGAKGLGEATGTVVVPSRLEVSGMAVSEKDSVLTFASTFSASDKVGGFSFYLEVQSEFVSTLDGKVVQDTVITEYLDLRLKGVEYYDGVSYRIVSVAEASKLKEGRSYSISRSIPLVKIEKYNGGMGVAASRRTTFFRAKFHAVHLSEEYCLYLKNADLESNRYWFGDGLMMARPVAYNNIEGGYGYLGAIYEQTSDWIEK